MKRISNVITAVIVAAVSLSCVSVCAVENFSYTSKRPAFARTEAKAEKKWLTDEENASRLEEFKADLAAKLEAGKITQEKYDAIISAIESGKFPFVGKYGKNIKCEKPRKNWLTDEENAAKLEKFKANLAAKLEAGKITQEKYDKIISAIESGNFEQFGECHGKSINASATQK